jgi:hypothetical protein
MKRKATTTASKESWERMHPTRGVMAHGNAWWGQGNSGYVARRESDEWGRELCRPPLDVSGMPTARRVHPSHTLSHVSGVRHPCQVTAKRREASMSGHSCSPATARHESGTARALGLEQQPKCVLYTGLRSTRYTQTAVGRGTAVGYGLYCLLQLYLIV